VSAAQFEELWRIGCFAGFLVGREAARRLVPLGRGTVTSPAPRRACAAAEFRAVLRCGKRACA
jgi:hypothetical protein